MNMHKTIVIGRLGRDPETREISSGVSVTGFSVAVNEKWKNKSGETQEHTEWYKIQAWGSQGDFVGRYLKQGDLVYVEGRMRTRQYDRDGTTVYHTDLNADRVTALTPRDHGSLPAAKITGGMPAQDEDLPF